MAKRITALALGALAIVAVGAGRARAMDDCIADAHSDFVACKDQCTSDLQDAKALCKGVAPGCFGACVDGRSECVDSAKQPLTDCLAGCSSTLSASRAQCKADTGCSAPEDPCNQNVAFIACMNGPQAAAFTCRDACRDGFRLNTTAQATLLGCKRGFKACVRTCPPATN
jgi:hypothetical protein